MGIFKKIKGFITSLFPPESYNCCYSDMVDRGCADNNRCGGLVGGTKATGYLSEGCIECPYLFFDLKRSFE